MSINVNWMLQPFDRHIDCGFGSMARSFQNAAKCLMNVEERFEGSDYVTCFLFRHSIELALKSMILILHKSQAIPFPELTKTGSPKISSGKPLYGTHSLTHLYEHFEVTIKTHWEEIKRPGWTDWSDMPPSISEGVARADKVDPGSFGFRYPDTDNPASDTKALGRVKNMEEVFSDINDKSKPPQKLLLMIDDDSNIVEAFDFSGSSLAEEITFLSELAERTTAASFGMHCEMSVPHEQKG